MRKYVYYCDICDMDGEEEKATHRYWDIDNNAWEICKKHFKLVKETKDLKWEILGE